MSSLSVEEPAALAPQRTPPWALARPNPVRRRANTLGWLSVGLGLAQLMAPRRMARWIGVQGDAGTDWALRAIGLRELSCGMGLLSQSHSAAWAWARVAGDVLDLALLASAPRRNGTERTLGAAAGVVGIALLDARTALELQR